jgi:4-alpha-glucanotransferase
MQEEANPLLIKAACKLAYDSTAVFCLQLISDILSLTDCIEEDYYSYRINTPGTTRPENWSVRMPLSLEELLAHPVDAEIKAMITSSSRD